MKVQIEGGINAYYVQMLCMIFFPGTNFKVETQQAEGEPSLYVRVEQREGGVYAFATMTADGKSADGEQFTAYKPDATKEKTAKLAVGSLVELVECFFVNVPAINLGNTHKCVVDSIT